jgi:autotransporter translocation and assembly factor TamB
MVTIPTRRRWLAILLRVALLAVAAVTLAGLVGAFVIRTGWANNQARELLLAQAARYLNATLEIERIDGSLFGGVRFVNVRLSRDGETIVAMDALSVSYGLRELFGDRVTVRHLTLTRPRVAAARHQDGSWNVAGLIRRPERTGSESGPSRVVAIPSIDIVDGLVTLGESVSLGATRLPARFEKLNLSLRLEYRDAVWSLGLSDTSWTASQPDLRLENLSGSLTIEPGGLDFRELTLETPRSQFAFSGSVSRGTSPTVLNLNVHADRFAFQEWATIVPGLSNISIESSFDASLQGPLEHLSTTFDLMSNGGDMQGDIVLDNSVPGWHGGGTVTLDRFDLAPWLDRPDQPSDITGRLEFDMDLYLGRGFPRTVGTYLFDGSRAAIFGYESSELLARGRTTVSEVVIEEATLIAYGAPVRLTSGSVGFEAPFPFRFVGSTRALDLRRVPSSVPVPRVPSRLAFAYDVAGQFRDPLVRGSAAFGPSVFLGAQIENGATGEIDTAMQPFAYVGDGRIRELDLGRFGRELNIGWLQDSRYAGTLEGRFHVEGSGGDAQTRRVDASGRLDQATLFDGVFSDADVTVQIDHGSLTASFDGSFDGVNAATAFVDSRLDAPLTGSGSVSITVPGLLVQSPKLADYAIDGNVTLEALTIRDVYIERAALTGALTEGSLEIREAQVIAPLVDAQGTGVVDLVGRQITRFDYDVTRGDLGRLGKLVDVDLSGQITTAGRMTGSLEQPHGVGRASLGALTLPGAATRVARIDYDLIVPSAAPEQLSGQMNITAGEFELLGHVFPKVAGDFALAGHIVGLNVDVTLVDAPDGAPEAAVTGNVRGTAALHADRHGLDLTLLEIAVADVVWRMSTSTATSVVTWGAGEVAIDALEVVRGESERIGVSGTWQPAGGSALRIAAADVFLDTFVGFFGGETRYGGTMNLDATLGGSWERPFIAGRVIITDGRVRRLPYEQLAGRVDYADEMFTVDLRLDQAPGIWLTASGDLPAAIFDERRPERPMRLAIASSPIALGLLEGVTDVIREVTGEMQVEVTALGTSHDPHFSGSIAITDAGFQVAATGARYRGGRGAALLDRERVTVNSMTLTDVNGQVLEVRGSLGTHEMTVGDIAIEVSAQGFQVLDNEYGRVDVDAQVSVIGRFESPRVSGDVTLTDGALQADTILDRILFQPYSGASTTFAIDALAALNPWERLGLDVFLHVPGTVRLVGDNVQVTEGTPLGLGSFDLRVFGDPYLYKDPGGPMYVTGSLDQVTGTYAFQGRRFDLDPESSINFRGDLSPEVWITVNRVISGVETRVSIIGPLREPELQLASTPPLDSSDILSLIVFNTSTNQLSIAQQQELAVRAGTLAAGFLTTPLLTALERSIGIDTLEIESGTVGSDIRLTIGDEIAPGLVARFSRQFGQNEYEEATIEYSLSRILRIRATFSDAGALASRSPLQRYERAGIDLLLFFSF